MFAEIITIWKNTDGCAEQYGCTTALYLLSMLAHAYNLIINCGVGSPLHGREVVNSLNATEKRFISMLMKTVQLPDAADYDLRMAIHTSTEKRHSSLARVFQKHLPDPTR